MFRRHSVGVVASLVLLLSLAAAAPAGAKLVADYRLAGDRSSAVAGAPDLFDLPPGGWFESASVANCTRQVFGFLEGGGLGFTGGEVISPEVFTLIVQVKLDEADGYVRLVNWFPSLANDNGLYTLDGALNFYDNTDPSESDHTGPTTVPPGVFAEFAVTRDASQRITGYTNGVRQFAYVDAADQAVTPHPSGNVYLFVDNGSEESAGKVARVRVYDTALPAAQITNTEGCFNRRCGGRTVTLAGDRRANVLLGTPGRDVIAGLGGNDDIRGMGGRDIICGGPGRDRLLGARGNDLIRGDVGADRLVGGRGRDRLVGGKGRDRCFGGPGRDRGLGCERGRL